MNIKSVSAEQLATAQAFNRCFEQNADGKLVLEKLTAIFSRNSYVRGGQEAERETLVRLGENNVIHFIVNQINTANGVVVEDLENDD